MGERNRNKMSLATTSQGIRRWETHTQKPTRTSPKTVWCSNQHHFGIYLLSVVIFVLGCSYASVPLYQLYCQASGLGGLGLKASSEASAEKLAQASSGLQQQAKKKGAFS